MSKQNGDLPQQEQLTQPEQQPQQSEQKQEKKKISALNIILFVLFIAGVTFITIQFTPYIMGFVKNPQKLQELIDSYGTSSIASILIYILFMISHVVIVIIPGEVIQIAGGAIFGTVWGTVYSVIGIILGMTIVFFASRFFGYGMVKSVIPQKNLEKFNFLINSEKSEIAMFVLFLIPGLPKDALTYIAGITPIKPLRFLIIATVARFPGLLGSSIIGKSIQDENWVLAIVVSVVALVLFIIGIIMRDKIINAIHRKTKKE